jgi:hypothetical protein
MLIQINLWLITVRLEIKKKKKMGNKASSLGTTLHSPGLNLGLNNERPLTPTTGQTCHFEVKGIRLIHTK